MPRRASLLLNILLVVAVSLSGLLVDGAIPAGGSRAMIASPDSQSAGSAAPMLAGKRARTKQDRRHDRRKDASQDRKKDRKQADRQHDRKQDRKQDLQPSEQVDATDRAENIQQLCTEAGAIWQPESNQCTHGPDPLPPGFAFDQPVAPVAEAAIEQDLAAFACDGNGTTGYRVQVLYVYPEEASRFTEYRQSFLNWTADMDGIFKSSAAETQGFRQVRFVHDATCTPIVTPVAVPAATIRGWDSLIRELQRRGFNSLTRIYLMFVDTNAFCGVGSWWPDDSPDPNTNPSNVGRSYARVDNICWSGDVAAHEVMHNLGGVQDSAPNSSKGAHCIDEWDIMCYRDSPYYPSMRYDCVNSALDETLLDCNHNDYYNTNPVPGSYLASCWNPANNRFLIGATQQSSSTQCIPPPLPPAPAPAIVSPPDGSTDTVTQNKHKQKKHKKKHRKRH